MKLASVLIAFSLAGLACSESPTEPVEFGEFRGIWEIEVHANTSCHANAIAHTINLGIDTVNLGDGVRRIGGIWEIGPSVVGSSFTGEFDPDARVVTMLLVHTTTQGAIAFEGTARSNDRIDGRTVPPTGRDAHWPIGSCEQEATARKVMNFPEP